MVVSQMSSDVTIKGVSSRLGAATQMMIVVIGLMKIAVPQIHQVCLHTKLGKGYIVIFSKCILGYFACPLALMLFIYCRYELIVTESVMLHV
jgi:hypothetical protein